MTPIQEFYKGRTIFVTGGTGFMGKVFLEKVVRSLPDIKRVYVLIRVKRGLTPQERIKKLITSVPFTFNNIPQENLEKIVPVAGDISKPDFELSPEDQQMLIEEVSVVFHLAASIRMDLPLKEAVITNVLSTLQLFNFCTKIKNFVAVIHLSTAFCNIEMEVMEEKVYPMNINPYSLIDEVQWMDDDALKALEKHLLPPHPNTYTFTKRLAEMIAVDLNKKIPVCILRPSIVLPALYEPVPGWVDSFNGPIGMCIAAGKGVLRTSFGDRDLIPQVIPVDIAINCLIVLGYNMATNDHHEEIPVFHATQGEKYQYSWGQAFDHFRILVAKYPFKKMLWIPGADFTKNYYLNQVYMVLFQMIPAVFVDFLLILFMQKPFLVNVQRRIYHASKLMQYFAIKEWKFTNVKATAVMAKLSAEDYKIFINNIDICVEDYLTSIYFGARKYCVKDDLEDMHFYRLQYKAFYLLDILVKVLLTYYVMKFIIFILQTTIFL